MSIPKISIKDAGKFASSAAGDYFTLKDDGDVARVRFLYDAPDGSDLDYYLVHQVEVDGVKKYVACNGIGEDGRLHTDRCPLCMANYKRMEKLFLQMCYDGDAAHEDDDKILVWERGKNFVGKIQTYINRLGSLFAQPVEIERHGKAGDTNTTYELFPLEVDNAVMEDYPERLDLIGSFILELSEGEMYDVIDGRYHLPGSEDNASSRGATRRNSSTGNSRTSSSASQRTSTSRRSRNSTAAEDNTQQEEQTVTRTSRSRKAKPAEKPEEPEKDVEQLMEEKSNKNLEVVEDSKPETVAEEKPQEPEKKTGSRVVRRSRRSRGSATSEF